MEYTTKIHRKLITASLIFFLMAIFLKVLPYILAISMPGILVTIYFFCIFFCLFSLLCSICVFIKNRKNPTVPVLTLIVSFFLFISFFLVLLGSESIDYFTKFASTYSGNLSFCNSGSILTQRDCIKSTLKENIDSINPTDCNKTKIANDCFQYMAVSKKDISICELNKMSYDAISCQNYFYFSKAIEELNREICYKIKEEREGDWMTNQCLYKISTLGNSTEICLNLEKDSFFRNECIIYLAIQNNNSDFCNNIKDEPYTNDAINRCKDTVNLYTTNGKSIADYIKYQNSRVW